ncbi:hypothetical protein M2163_001660 [Streptomyces sp. SAI-135]|uniref:hypothetical protein n=1 Tax=unclassified Streptomyces TaxID=2593676 RepID=UPI002475F2D9|nr:MULTISPECIES: hypothetical protein [unclassified Streptomyces]MDH6521352.1 hypothetical protein [Streptomyces sp. SAI-090]MDH6614552.1 hypothetical protein [Streptomyces sp. SAI-135]
MTVSLAPRRFDTGTHDLGCLFYPSWVTAWRLTGDDTSRTGAVEAAGFLIRRYNPRGRFTLAWGVLTDPKNAGRVIIDTMTNLDLLAFARALADFAVRALGPDHVPVWDHRAPQQAYDIKDASAGAIMACGLLDLAAATGRTGCRDVALRLLTALSETCPARNSARAEAVVARCTRNHPAENGIEISQHPAGAAAAGRDRAIDLSTTP